MRNKSLIFLSLLAFGLVGCNQNTETTDATTATTTTEQQTEVVGGDNKAPVTAPVNTKAPASNNMYKK